MWALLARGVVRGKERVVEDEAGDLAAKLHAGDVIEPRVLAGEDPAQTGLLRRGSETRERASHTWQSGRGDRERLMVTVEAAEHVGTCGADRALRTGVRGVGRGVDREWEPGRVGNRQRITVGVGKAD